MRVALIEIYDDREALLARGAELGRRPPLSLGQRTGRRYMRAFAERDWAAFAAVFADDATVDDRRAVVAQDVGGLDDFIAVLRSWTEASDDMPWSIEPVAASAHVE